LASEKEREICEAIRAQLHGTPFSQIDIVATSTTSGRGLAELKLALARTLAKMTPPRNIGKPRLPVDRVFTLRGIGTVVTGTLTGGEFSRGQSVGVEPGGQVTRIRSLQSHGRDVERAGPGTRTALSLADLSGHSE